MTQNAAEPVVHPFHLPRGRLEALVDGVFAMLVATFGLLMYRRSPALPAESLKK